MTGRSLIENYINFFPYYYFVFYVDFKCQTTTFNSSKLIFLTSSFNNSTNTGRIDMFFTKNVTTFHRQQDGIIHFCLNPNKRGVLALWIYIFIKKIMDFSKLNCSTFSYHNSTNTGLIEMFFTKKWKLLVTRKKMGMFWWPVLYNDEWTINLWMHDSP